MLGKKPALLCLFLAFPVFSSLAQQRCATNEFMQLQHEFRKQMETTEQFENWLKQRRELKRSAAPDSRLQDIQDPVITIPVVVHVIHRGEAPGIGANIPDEQIFSQIEVLNEDFRRTNADAVNTPAVFAPVAADIEIEFALAVRDPEGLPTNGIVRKNGERSVWQLTDNYALKEISQWPAEDYLNIYVIDLNDNFVGYAQFPESSLQGLETASENPFTEGIIVDYKAFGSEAKYPEADLFPAFNLGRTATHEVGHYLGLRHIWGDGGCGVDDFVSDTPLQGDDNGGLGSPCSFPGPNTCNTGVGDLPDMFQNYMDYTNDLCLNLFTEEQKVRMRIVMDNSPRRISLASSDGLTPPVQFSNDAGIRQLLSPSVVACPDPASPVIEVRNYGDNTVASVEIATSVDGSEVSRNVYPVNLAPGELTSIALIPVTLTQPGELTVEITSVNGTTDPNASNNLRTRAFTVSEVSTTSFNIDFDFMPPDWMVANPDGQFTWEITQAPSSSPSNNALFINFYDYENLGDLDLFISPIIDLTNATNALLTFDVAYGGFASSLANNEGLLITITDDCEDPLFAGDTVYYKVGDELRSTNPSGSEFVPSGPGEWRTDVVNLLPYLGRQVRLSFVSINAFGNNLYLDNISLDLGNPLALTAPDYIFCEDNVPVEVAVNNILGVEINSFDVTVRIDRSVAENFTWTGSLPAGEVANVATIIPPISPGIHEMEVEIDNINNMGITFGTNSSIIRDIQVNENMTLLPFREDFENYPSANSDAWVYLTQTNTPGFDIGFTNYGKSVVLDASVNNTIGDVDVFASPGFSLLNARQAYFTFDLAYAQLNEFGDFLEVRLSRDCGMNYDELLFSRNSEDWPESDFTDAPESPSHWETISLDLNAYLGEPDVRLGFFVTNANGGRMFLDNFEFFVSRPVVAENGTVYPNPTGSDGMVYVTFNTEQSETIELRLINSMGQVLVVEEYNNILNQTLPVNMSGRAPGVYILHVTGETFSFSKRVIHGIY